MQRLLRPWIFSIPFVAIFAFSTHSMAKVFRNAYVSFELPDRWDCRLEGTEWVCNSQIAGNSKEAIIVLTAKEVGPTDTFEAYEQHLNIPRSVPGPNGKPVMSSLKHLRRRQIANHMWVDSMHLGSEIPAYYTRYLATIKDRLAILVTFSAHQRYFTKYSTDFFRAIESLRVVATKDLFDVNALAPTHPGSETIGTAVAGPSDLGTEVYPEESSGAANKKNNTGKLIILAFLISAVGVYFFLKKKKKI